MTKGQWLQMNATSSGCPLKSARRTVRPLAGSISAKSGAGVFNASIFDGVRAMVPPLVLCGVGAHACLPCA